MATATLCVSLLTGVSWTLVIALISGRLTMVRKKRNMIAEAEKAQITAGRRRSGDMTPKSVRSHASS